MGTGTIPLHPRFVEIVIARMASKDPTERFRVPAPEAPKVLANGLGGIDPDRKLVSVERIGLQVIEERIVLLGTNGPILEGRAGFGIHRRRDGVSI